MPKGIVKTKEDERLWKRVKETVSRNEHLPTSKFKDEHWKRVNALFHKIKNNKEK